jgi:hypothetical protein
MFDAMFRTKKYLNIPIKKYLFIVTPRAAVRAAADKFRVQVIFLFVFARMAASQPAQETQNEEN